MPTRGGLRASALRAAISCEMMRIDGRQVHDADGCDEIVNNALMENATGQGLCFQCLEVGVDRGGLESVTYAKRAHCLISQQQELKNTTVKKLATRESEPSDGVPEILPRLRVKPEPLNSHQGTL